ncbi:hypothetical protein [Paractinoplanes lichenicola]|uniref:CBM6 domain-containing protein n=1 Tax=Paractinoplanes lichenicola TaxID=2802976 RepID=A0ABS1W614_9ACTN|nr:hypothetical protein [Actinoplanes lichenicola]MBL7262153.1 hypothetical protein [Actinoplanes lichenicola]
MSYVWAAIATVFILGMLAGIAWLVVRLAKRRHPRVAASVGLGGLLAIVVAVASIANDSFFNMLEAVENLDSKQSPSLTPMGPDSAVSGDPSSTPSGNLSPPASRSPGESSNASPPTLPSPSESTNASPAAEASQLPTPTAEKSGRANLTPAAPKAKVVRFVGVSGAGNQVMATVEVESPPEAGRHYILVARFDKPSRYDMKVQIPATKGTHQLQFDLGEAPENSWRDFAALAVSNSEMVRWRTTLDGESLSDMPGGKVVAGWRPYRR